MRVRRHTIVPRQNGQIKPAPRQARFHQHHGAAAARAPCGQQRQVSGVTRAHDQVGRG
jgi:hypothetical protein